jgi:hypothetical protein
MTEKSLLPWVGVNSMMDDVYRQQVVTDALNHYPHASSELHKFTMDIFKKSIQIKGFRSFQNVPLHIAKPYVINEFKTNSSIATAIVCLWAEKQCEIIESLKKTARDANIPVHIKWGWQEARHGFMGAEDIPELDQLANTLAEQKTKPESDHYLLASLWLSSSLLVEEMQEPESKNNEANIVHQPGSAENARPIPIETIKKNLSKVNSAVFTPQDTPAIQPDLDTAELNNKSIKLDF